MSNLTGAEMVTCWTLIELLTQDEVSGVTILNPNPDFGAPGYAVEVSGEWTGYEDRRFEGDSILQCLDEANRARVAWRPLSQPERRTISRLMAYFATKDGQRAARRVLAAINAGDVV